MSKQTISFSCHSSFRLTDTVRMLQRGPSDPINVILNNEWYRCICLNNSQSLINIKHDHVKNIITITVLYGEISLSSSKEIVIKSLGMDTPPRHNIQINEYPLIKKLEDTIGLTIPCYLDLYEAIVQIIIGQQISANVANGLREKFVRNFGLSLCYNERNYYCFPSPQRILQLKIDTLRSLGLSKVKCKAILLLAEVFVNNDKILELNINSESNEIRKLLTSFYGVGEWTVDWLMIRYFRKFETIPKTDLAVKKAFTWWINQQEIISSEQIKEIENRYYPLSGLLAYHVLYAYSKKISNREDM